MIIDGEIASAVGYQPTLASEMGALQERITSATKKGSITSVQVCICAWEWKEEIDEERAKKAKELMTLLTRLQSNYIYPSGCDNGSFP